MKSEQIGRPALKAWMDNPRKGVEAAWAEEVERRVRQLESGEVKTIPWGEVREALYARLNEKR